ncbi:hypothetical protein M8J76_003904 [Diaphorina citri]|nr:hypothetical protein M8J76_003904 [Diaphorina citri]
MLVKVWCGSLLLKDSAKRLMKEEVLWDSAYWGERPQTSGAQTQTLLANGLLHSHDCFCQQSFQHPTSLDALRNSRY